MKNKQINFFFFILIIILIINCFYSTANLLTNKKVMGKQIGSNLNPEATPYNPLPPAQRKKLFEKIKLLNAKKLNPKGNLFLILNYVHNNYLATPYEPLSPHGRQKVFDSILKHQQNSINGHPYEDYSNYYQTQQQQEYYNNLSPLSENLIHRFNEAAASSSQQTNKLKSKIK
uniref:Uncharacterized protein n=1 Tax=Meloidogyne enterolobii TaxID=390850 RepID=A0A6V7UZ10_MELEN|nr:unnamed protein product [Meloidogyne enterolobii]